MASGLRQAVPARQGSSLVAAGTLHLLSDWEMQASDGAHLSWKLKVSLLQEQLQRGGCDMIFQFTSSSWQES